MDTTSHRHSRTGSFRLMVRPATSLAFRLCLVVETSTLLQTSTENLRSRSLRSRNQYLQKVMNSQRSRSSSGQGQSLSFGHSPTQSQNSLLQLTMSSNGKIRPHGRNPFRHNLNQAYGPQQCLPPGYQRFLKLTLSCRLTSKRCR